MDLYLLHVHFQETKDDLINTYKDAMRRAVMYATYFGENNDAEIRLVKEEKARQMHLFLKPILDMQSQQVCTDCIAKTPIFIPLCKPSV